MDYEGSEEATTVGEFELGLRMAMIAGMDDKPASRQKRMPKVKGGCKGWEAKWGKRDERMMEMLFYINDHPGTSIATASEAFNYVYSTVGDYIKGLRDARLITTARLNGVNKSYNTITALGRQRLAQINNGEM